MVCPSKGVARSSFRHSSPEPLAAPNVRAISGRADHGQLHRLRGSREHWFHQAGQLDFVLTFVAAGEENFPVSRPLQHNGAIYVTNPQALAYAFHRDGRCRNAHGEGDGLEPFAFQGFAALEDGAGLAGNFEVHFLERGSLTGAFSNVTLCNVDLPLIPRKCDTEPLLCTAGHLEAPPVRCREGHICNPTTALCEDPAVCGGCADQLAVCVAAGQPCAQRCDVSPGIASLPMDSACPVGSTCQLVTTCDGDSCSEFLCRP